MSDFNVSVAAIDSAMDCFEKISDAASNYQKVVQYDVSQLRSSLAYKSRIISSRIDDLFDKLSYLDDEDEDERDRLMSEIQSFKEKLSVIDSLNRRASKLESQYRSESKGLINAINNDVSNGLKQMAEYLREVSGIGTIGSANMNVGVSNIYTGDSNYAVVVIDSNKYPQSAEHIRVAINMGYPAMLTLYRPGADNNRKLSLEGRPISPLYDRDEYPPAAFMEGGAGAHVAYIDPSDNSGSGSSFSWQLRGIPDGTRVRFRVI